MLLSHKPVPLITSGSYNSRLYARTSYNFRLLRNTRPLSALTLADAYARRLYPNFAYALGLYALPAYAVRELGRSDRPSSSCRSLSAHAIYNAVCRCFRCEPVLRLIQRLVELVELSDPGSVQLPAQPQPVSDFGLSVSQPH